MTTLVKRCCVPHWIQQRSAKVKGQCIVHSVCLEAASFSPARACAPWSPTELLSRIRVSVCSEGASFISARACACVSQQNFR